MKELPARVHHTNWAELSACGSAAQIPDLLAAMLEGDEWAWNELWNLLMYQDLLYPAATALIPVLHDWLADPSAPHRQGIWSFLRVALDIPAQDTSPHYAEIYGMTYASVVQPVHDAIRAGYPLYLERARNGDDIDRAGAYELLGDLPEACPEALPLLLERATAESDGRLQLIALDALRKLAPYATEEQREGLLTRMLNIMSDEHLPFGTRIAAVRTLAGTAPQRLPAWTPDLFVAQAQERARQMGPDTISLSFSEAVCVLEQRHDLLRPLLESLLAHPLIPVRKGAIEAVQGVAEVWRAERHWAGETLTAQLSRESGGEAHLHLIEKVGQLGRKGQQAAPQLVQMAYDPDAATRLAVVSALVRLRCPEGIDLAAGLLESLPLQRLEPLVWALRERDELPQQLTRPVLGLLRRTREAGLQGDPEEFLSPAQQLAGLWANLVGLTSGLRGYDAEIETELVATMQATSYWQIFNACAEELGLRRARGAVPALLEEVHHVSQGNTASFDAVLEALARIADPSTLDILLAQGLHYGLPPAYLEDLQAAYLRAVDTLADSVNLAGTPDAAALAGFEQAVTHWLEQGQPESGLLALAAQVRVAESGQWPMLQKLLPFLNRDTEASAQIIPLLYALERLSLDKGSQFRLTVADALLRLAGDPDEFRRFTGDIAAWQPLVKSPLTEEEAAQFRGQMLSRLTEDPRCQPCVRGQDAIWQDEQAQAWARQRLNSERASR